MIQKKLDISELIVIILYSFYLLLLILKTTVISDALMIPSIIKVYKLFMIGGLTINLMIHLKKLSIFKLFSLIGLIGLIALVALKSDLKTDLIVIFLFVLNGYFIKTTGLFKAYLYTSIISVSTIVLLALLGVIENDALIETRAIRYYLGFVYTLFTPNFFLHILTVYIAIKNKHITVLETIIIFVLNHVIYQLTNGRSVYFITIFSLLILWIYKLYPKIMELKLTKTFMYSLYSLFAFISIGISYIYTDTNYYFRLLNKALSNRLYLGHVGIEKYGFSLFGQYIDFETGRAGIERSGEYFYVDSSFLNISLTLGIIMAVLLIVGFTMLMIVSYQSKNYFLCIALIILALHSLIDDVFFDFRYNPFLLLLGLLIANSLREVIHLDNWSS